MLKGAISISKVFPLLDDAKRLAPSATPQEKAAFQAAGKRIEGAAKGEARCSTLKKSSAASVPAPSSAVPPLSLPAPGRRAAWPPGTYLGRAHGTRTASGLDCSAHSGGTPLAHRPLRP